LSLTLTTKEPLFVRIGSSRAVFQGLEHVSRAYRKLVAHYDVGSSRAPLCIIETENGEGVGRVSYNGRVWNGVEWTVGDKPLYCPSEEVAS